jgi:hypothetical protein
LFKEELWLQQILKKSSCNKTKELELRHEMSTKFVQIKALRSKLACPGVIDLPYMYIVKTEKIFL